MSLSLLSSGLISLGAAWANEPQANLKDESLGGLKLELPFHKVIKLIGRPQETTKGIKDHESGCIKRVHFYRNGLEVETCKNDENERVYSLRVVKERGVKTSRGIGVGAHADEITKVYPHYVRKGSHAIVLSDPRNHNKLRFLLEGGEIYEISLYHDLNYDKRSQQRAIKKRRRRVLFGQ